MRRLTFVCIAAVAACRPTPSVPPDAQPAPVVRSPAAEPAPLARATQLVVVTTPGWDAVEGELRRYSRAAVGASWRAEGAAEPIVVGRGGLGWGIGFAGEGPRKVEGDGRAPAGVFPFGRAFGFAPADSASWLRMPYVPLTSNTECVDDVASSHYNRVLERDAVGRVDWSSAERMRRIPQYRLGVIVDYNAAPPTPGRGSCIFFHIWERRGAPTVGCTAMDAGVLESLMAWLDPRTRPVVVQLPEASYGERREEWGLPALR